MKQPSECLFILIEMKTISDVTTFVVPINHDESSKSIIIKILAMTSVKDYDIPKELPQDLLVGIHPKQTI